MGESKSFDYTRYIGKEIPAVIAESVSMFSIEYSIPMRKPKGHFSRAPGVLFSILQSHPLRYHYGPIRDIAILFGAMLERN